MKDQEYQAIPMTCAEAPSAYPLVYLHDASVSLDAWLDFVNRRTGCDNESGLIALHDRARIVHALFAYRVDSNIKGQRQLCIAQLIVAQIPGSQIDQAVMAATRRIANDFDCATITIEQSFDMRGSTHVPAWTAA